MFNFNTFLQKLNSFSKIQQNVMKTQPISPKTPQNFPKTQGFEKSSSCRCRKND